MKSIASRALRLVIPVGLAMTVIAAPAMTAGAATSAPSCPSFYFIGARGSGESAQTPAGGLGTEVGKIATDVANAVNAQNLTMQTVADSYSAASVYDFIPSSAEVSKLQGMISAGNESGAISYYYNHNVVPYLASIKAGVKAAVSEARVLNYYCPQSKLLMAGYSQGAMVVHQAEWRLAHSYPAVAAQIVGTVLLADGDRVPNSTAHSFGTATSGGEGVRTWLKENNGKDAWQPSATASICNAGDIVCDFNWHRVYPAPSSEQAGAQVHTSYANDPSLAQAATWVAAQALAE
jgi:hypothetical protein